MEQVRPRSRASFRNPDLFFDGGYSKPRLTLLGAPRVQRHAVFKIPQTHNMLTSLFDPRTPKSVRTSSTTPHS